MLKSREKIGTPDIDWKRFALGSGCYRRKTVGFGNYFKKERMHEFELYIRELSVVDGGTGAAVWDAAIILARFLRDRGDLLIRDKEVIELGSGTGLPGLMAATMARRMILSDAVPSILKNLQYNIDVNAKLRQPEDDADYDALPAAVRHADQQLRSQIGTACVRSIDWDVPETYPAEFRQRFDVIIGSELTYTPISSKSLVDVMDFLLKPGGLFIEILSEDRDGVGLFVSTAKQHDYEVVDIPVADQYLGHYGTGQRAETYRLYFAWQRAAPTPVLPFPLPDAPADQHEHKQPAAASTSASTSRGR